MHALSHGAGFSLAGIFYASKAIENLCPYRAPSSNNVIQPLFCWYLTHPFECNTDVRETVVYFAIPNVQIISSNFPTMSNS